MKGNLKDFLIGIIYIAFGLSAVVIAREYSMGTALRMGPAYFPTVLGGLLILVGLISVVRGFLRPGTPVGGVALKKLALITLSVIVFGLIVKGAGLIIALPVLVIMSGAVLAGILGQFLTKDAEVRNEDSELLDLNV